MQNIFIFSESRLDNSVMKDFVFIVIISFPYVSCNKLCLSLWYYLIIFSLVNVIARMIFKISINLFGFIEYKLKNI